MDNTDSLTSACEKIVVQTIANIARAEVGTNCVGTIHLTPIDIQLTLINVCQESIMIKLQLGLAT